MQVSGMEAEKQLQQEVGWSSCGSDVGRQASLAAKMPELSTFLSVLRPPRTRLPTSITPAATRRQQPPASPRISQDDVDQQSWIASCRKAALFGTSVKMAGMPLHPARQDIKEGRDVRSSRDTCSRSRDTYRHKQQQQQPHGDQAAQCENVLGITQRRKELKSHDLGAGMFHSM